MEECTKCKSRDVFTKEEKTTKGYKIEVVYCRRCKTETRATLILSDKDQDKNKV